MHVQKDEKYKCHKGMSDNSSKSVRVRLETCSLEPENWKTGLAEVRPGVLHVWNQFFAVACVYVIGNENGG